MENTGGVSRVRMEATGAAQDTWHFIKRSPQLSKAFVGAVWETSLETCCSRERWKKGLALLFSSRVGLCARLGLRAIDVVGYCFGKRCISSFEIKLFYQCLVATKLGSSPVECFSVLVRLFKNVGKFAHQVFRGRIPDIYLYVLIIFRGCTFLAKAGNTLDYFVEYGALILPAEYKGIIFWKKIVGNLPSLFLLLIRTIEIISWGLYVETHSLVSGKVIVVPETQKNVSETKQEELLAPPPGTSSAPVKLHSPPSPWPSRQGMLAKVVKEPLPKKQVQLYAAFLASEWVQEFLGSIGGVLTFARMNLITLPWAIDPATSATMALFLSVAGLLIKVASCFLEEPDFKVLNNPGYVKPVDSEVVAFLKANNMVSKFEHSRTRFARPAFVLPDTD